MSTVIDAPARTARRGFDSLENETHVESLPVRGDLPPWLQGSLKVDVVERGTRIWEESGSFPGEPVFVAAPDAEAEDEGVLLSVVLDGDRGSSFLLVLDARDLSELARAEVPHHIPFGFHGQFARA